MIDKKHSYLSNLSFSCGSKIEKALLKLIRYAEQTVFH